MKARFWLASALSCIAALPAIGQIAVSSNDGKQPGHGTASGQDSITILDLSTSPASSLATLEMPTSMIGPPASVALARDGSFAIVTSSLKADLNGALISDDRVNVVDLSTPTRPKLIQTVHAGSNASGVAIHPDATLALVANRTGDSLSLFTIKANTLTPAGTIALPKGSTPLDVAFSSDGLSAYVVTNGDGRLVRLDVTGSTVNLSGQWADLGRQPYSLTINDKAGVAYVTNLGGRRGPQDGSPRTGTLSIVDLHGMRELQQIDVGITPEHVSISPQGNYVEVNLINGSNAKPDAENYKDHGFLTVFAVRDRMLEHVATTPTGQWCQGAAWNTSQTRIYLQCAEHHEIEAYAFDGKALTHLPEETIMMPARPGSIATADDR